MTEISLYFHIPFCTKKCPYCHFYVVPNRLPFHEVLREGIALEWEQRAPLWQGAEIVSVYFGGGTPSLFAPGGIREILGKIPVAKDCEITIEANPEELTPLLLEQLLGMGINRLSLGVQSLDDRSLQVLERIHSAKKAKTAVLDARRAGFQNVSIDLMYDLPDQTAASWEYTLSEVGSLPIQHVSLYNMTIEPHTVFFKRKEGLKLPDSHESLQFLNHAIQSLHCMGLGRYEISAFCKKGFESRHNTGYWTFRPFLGFGPSAFSFWGGKRWRNAANLQRYTRTLKEGNSPVDFEETLPYPQNVNEEIAIRLRLTEGVDARMEIPDATMQTLERLARQGLVEKKENRFRLTEKGSLFYDTVASEIV